MQKSERIFKAKSKKFWSTRISSHNIPSAHTKVWNFTFFMVMESPILRLSVCPWWKGGRYETYDLSMALPCSTPWQQDIFLVVRHINEKRKIRKIIPQFSESTDIHKSRTKGNNQRAIIHNKFRTNGIKKEFSSAIIFQHQA
jgi:hypothetical protein